MPDTRGGRTKGVGKIVTNADERLDIQVTSDGTECEAITCAKLTGDLEEPICTLDIEYVPIPCLFL